MSRDSSYAVDAVDGGVLKPLLALSGPIALANLLQVGYTLTDTFWVGRLGGPAVSALGFSWAIVFAVLSLAGGFNVAGSVLVARHRGADDPARVDRVAGQTVAFVGGVALLIAAAGYLATPTLLALVGATPGSEVYRMATAYTRVGFLGTPFVFGLYVYQGLLRGWGDSRTPLYVVGGSVVLNVLVDPFFVLGFRNNVLLGALGLSAVERSLYAVTGFGGLGVEGAAVATVVSRGLGAAVAVGLLLSGRVGVNPSPSAFVPRRAVVVRLVRLGVPASVEQATHAVGVAVLTALVATAGDPAVAAYSIGNRVLALLLLPTVAVAAGTQTMVGQRLGAERSDRVTRVVGTAAGALGGYLVIASAVTILLAEPIVSVLVTGDGSAAVVAHGAAYLRIVGVTFAFVGVFRVLKGAFRGGGATTAAMVASVASLVLLRVPAAYALVHWFGAAAGGVWYGIAFSNVAICLLAAAWFRRGTWADRLPGR